MGTVISVERMAPGGADSTHDNSFDAVTAHHHAEDRVYLQSVRADRLSRCIKTSGPEIDIPAQEPASTLVYRHPGQPSNTAFIAEVASIESPDQMAHNRHKLSVIDPRSRQIVPDAFAFVMVMTIAAQTSVAFQKRADGLCIQYRPAPICAASACFARATVLAPTDTRRAEHAGASTGAADRLIRGLWEGDIVKRASNR